MVAWGWGVAPMVVALHVMLIAKLPHSINQGVNASAESCVDTYEIYFLKNHWKVEWAESYTVGLIGNPTLESFTPNPESDGEVR